MALEFGWNWHQMSWVYLRPQIDLWDPSKEQANYDLARKRHLEMSKTEEGRALDTFADHVRKCPSCSSIDSICIDGEELWNKLSFKWKTWCFQNEKAAREGVPPSVLFEFRRRP